MLQKIKDWFVSLPIYCQEDITSLGTLNVISGKHISFNSNTDYLNPILEYMGNEDLSIMENLNRTLILYAVFDMAITTRLNMKWDIDLSPIEKAIKNSSSVPVIINPEIKELSDDWGKATEDAFNYQKNGKALWEEVNRSWSKLKEEELNTLKIEFYLLGD